MQGPHAFSNDYGAPRGGGAQPPGNDILAPRGTPVVANVGGVVTQRYGVVSGLAYFLAGDDGNRYFGAHLDSFGASGRVAAGTVIGTVGNTGDAVRGPAAPALRDAPRRQRIHQPLSHPDQVLLTGEDNSGDRAPGQRPSSMACCR